MSVKPHPAEKLPGFTKTVTLPLSGIDVVFRRVSLQAVTNRAQINVLSDPELRRAVEADDERAWQALASAGAVAGVLRLIVETGTLRPSPAELIDLYGGTRDQADCGMGSDFEFLAEEIAAFSNTAPQPAQSVTAKTTSRAKK